MDDRILEPEKAYREYYKQKFNDNAEAYYKELVKKSGINVESNRISAQKARDARVKADKSLANLSKKKGLRVFLIVLCVLAVLPAVVGIPALVNEIYLAGGLLLGIGLALGITFIVLIVAVLNPRIKLAQQIFDADEKIAKDFYEQALKEMAPLNALFEGSATKELIEKTVPLLQIDDDFTMRRYDYLSGKYGFGENTDENSSTIAVMTGEILGNPFVIDRELYTYMGSQTYTGTLVISWTTSYTDSEGHRRTQTHTQTLVATVTKPKPFYAKRTRLIYGNEAAPALSFSREPTHAEDLSEKKLERKVKSGSKKLKKLQNKHMTDDDPSTNFTMMGNEEFDVLFGATDRDNETEFRLLFTPLAQRNMLALMKSNEGYGDDFSFSKKGCLNYISSEHSEAWSPEVDCSVYRSYDVDIAGRQFVAVNNEYFKSLYFDFAPLLSIPIYQQHKPHEYIYKETYAHNYTGYEAEYAANKLGEGCFRHKQADTQSILKARHIGVNGGTDSVKITAYAYKTVEHVEVVPVWGGDGRMHGVPVPWTEYIPVQSERVIGMKRISASEKEYNGAVGGELKSAISKYAGASVWAHGIFCCVLTNENSTLEQDVNRILKK